MDDSYYKNMDNSGAGMKHNILSPNKSNINVNNFPDLR